MRTRTLTTTLVAAGAALALTACSSGGGGGDDTGATDTGTGGASGTITIGIKFDQPGLGLQDGSEYTGFDTDVARYVAKHLGYEEDQIEWFESPSAQRETLLENGQVDMIFAT
jgi:glutamate transport system substrate-binding protein